MDQHYRTLTDVASSIADRELSAVDLTEQMLGRITALEPTLHAYYNVYGEAALTRAAALDEAQSSGRPLGALHGVPIAVKDLCHQRGTETTGGHSFRRGEVSNTDSTVVERLEAAGAVVLGKLATTEGAMVGYHRDFDVPRNPWGDLDRWPGASSAGSGVATAAGLCFGSLGSDTGGSIRYPSAVNGIVGLKPTWGRVSRAGVLDLAPTLDHVGPMTRSVRDAARMLRVIAGRDERDPTSLAEPVDDYEGALANGIAGLRIGWDEAFACEDVEPHVARAMQDACAFFADAGASIVPVTVPRMDIGDAWNLITAAETAAVHATTYPAQADDYGAYFRAFLESGFRVNGRDLATAHFKRREVIGRLAPLFLDVDALLMPTIAEESFRYDVEKAYDGIDSAGRTMAGASVDWFVRTGRFVSIWDFNGYPTLSVPSGFSPDGIPLSLQLIAEPLGESTLCRLGHAFEAAHDFAARHPASV